MGTPRHTVRLVKRRKKCGFKCNNTFVPGVYRTMSPFIKGYAFDYAWRSESLSLSHVDGRTKGKRLDVDMQKIADKIRKSSSKKAPIDVFSALISNVRSLSQPAMRLCKALLAKRLVPVIAQLPVACDKYGTAIDLVCVNANSEKWLIEVKYGFDAYRTRAHTFMNGVLREFPNSAINQHCLQLYLTWLATRDTYPMAPIANTHVALVYVNSRCGVSWYTVDVLSMFRGRKLFA